MLYFLAMKRHPLTLATLVLLTPALAFAADEEGQPAPNFHAKTTTGETYTNANLKGKVVLLQFWTTWCPYCRREQSLIDSIDHEFAGKGVVVLAIDVAESKKKVQTILTRQSSLLPHSPNRRYKSRGDVSGEFLPDLCGNRS